HGDSAVTVEAANVRSGHSGDNRTDSRPRSFFRLVESGANCLNCRFDVYDHALSQTGAMRDALTQQDDVAFGAGVRDGCAVLAGADIEARQRVSHGTFLRLSMRPRATPACVCERRAAIPLLEPLRRCVESAEATVTFGWGSVRRPLEAIAAPVPD